MKTKEKTRKQRILDKLDTFYGSLTIYRFQTPFREILITPGCHYLIEECQCHWLFDDIVIFQDYLKSKSDFQVWHLTKDDLKSTKSMSEYTLTATDIRTDKQIYHTRYISDFPLDEIELFKIDDTICLPLER